VKMDHSCDYLSGRKMHRNCTEVEREQTPAENMEVVKWIDIQSSSYLFPRKKEDFVSVNTSRFIMVLETAFSVSYICANKFGLYFRPMCSKVSTKRCTVNVLKRKEKKSHHHT
jgi:hypothetical protein